jgi:hypothetical protein
MSTPPERELMADDPPDDVIDWLTITYPPDGIDQWLLAWRYGSPEKRQEMLRSARSSGTR